MNKKKYYLFKIDIGILNVVCTILLILLLLITLVIDKDIIDMALYDMNWGILLLLYIFYMGLHEIIHSVAYVINGANFNKIVYGVYLEKGVFYCLCKQNVCKRNILASLMVPLFCIGFVTYLIGLIIANPYLLMLSIFNISGCAGDIMMFYYINKLDDDIEFTELDDPISFAIYAKEDVSKVGHFGLNFVECVSKIKREDLKKIRISKISYVCLLIFVILCCIYLCFL